MYCTYKYELDCTMISLQIQCYKSSRINLHSMNDTFPTECTTKRVKRRHTFENSTKLIEHELKNSQIVIFVSKVKLSYEKNVSVC